MCSEPAEADNRQIAESDYIDVCVRYVVTTPFSKYAKSNEPFHGRVGRLRELLETIQSDPNSHIMQFPKARTQSGKKAVFQTGKTIAVYATDGITPIVRTYELESIVTPTLRKDGLIHLRHHFADNTQCGFPIIEGKKHTEASGSFLLANGDTCVIGGSKMNATDYKTTEVPLLSKLPMVGPWFQFSYEVEVEREVMILATVNRSVNP